MSGLAPALATKTSVASFVVPVPRTQVVAEVWAEFAYAVGAPQVDVDRIIKGGIENFLIDTAIISFLNKESLVVFETRLTMNWKKHEMLVHHETNINLVPQQPFTLQLHDGFEKLMSFARLVMRREQVARTQLAVIFRPEIRADPTLYARAQALLGVSECPMPKYAPGRVQPDLSFRFVSLPETTVVVREVWADRSGR
jgi:hypothetical protein